MTVLPIQRDIRNYVSIKGNVFRPGKYEYRKKRYKRKDRQERTKERRKRKRRSNRQNVRMNKRALVNNFGTLHFDDMIPSGKDIGKMVGKKALAIGAAAAGTAAVVYLAGQMTAQHGTRSPIAPGIPMSAKNAQNASGFQRATAVGTAGYLGGKSIFGTMMEYGWERNKDYTNTVFNSPLSKGGLAPATKVGAMVGGGLSLAAGTAISAFSKGGRMGVSGTLALGVFGSIMGGYQGSKVDMAFSRSIKVARKNILNAKRGGRKSNRASTSGKGYRMWAQPKGKRKMGQPGHLGMDGSMAFAMHHARGKTTL